MGPTIAGRQVFPVRCYLVDGLMVDTGPSWETTHMARVFATYPVEQVVNTHFHEDHAGNNDLAIARRLTPRIHALALPFLEAFPTLPLYRRWVWGQMARTRAEALGDTVETGRFRFDVLHTPGHSPDHVALLEREQGWLFAGDLFLGERLLLMTPAEDPFALMASLEATLKHGFDTIYCAHRGVVPNGREALGRKLAFLKNVQEQTLALHQQGLPPREIARRLLGKDDVIRLISRGEMERVNLINAFLPGWPGPAAPWPGAPRG